MSVTAATLRDVPHRYEAMLALCSDLDATPDARVYGETLHYLNGTSDTALGPGLGLEVGHSIYFDMPPHEFAYWNTDDGGREMVRGLIRSGHVDTLHSYGGLAATRAHAERALTELSRHGCRIEVWTDHSRAPTNFGADIMRGLGDVPGSPAYHADLTWAFGVRFVWRGRVTSVIGQDTARALGGVFDRAHPLPSLRTVGKEAAKGLLGRLGSAKYAMHAANHVLRPARLRDGRAVWEFLRGNPHWKGVDEGESASGLAEALGPRVLDTLLRRRGVALLYTHLGRVDDPREPLRAPTRAALLRVAELYRQGRLLVTTPRRVLGYCRARRSVSASLAREGDWFTLALRTAGDDGRRSDLDGLTVYVPDPERTRVLVDGHHVPGVRVHPPDHTGRRSVSLPWPRLDFPRWRRAA